MTAPALDWRPDGWFAPCQKCSEMGWVEWRSYYNKLPRYEADKTTPHECKGRRNEVKE